MPVSDALCSYWVRYVILMPGKASFLGRLPSASAGLTLNPTLQCSQHCQDHILVERQGRAQARAAHFPWQVIKVLDSEETLNLMHRLIVFLSYFSKDFPKFHAVRAWGAALWQEDSLYLCPFFPTVSYWYHIHGVPTEMIGFWQNRSLFQSYFPMLWTFLRLKKKGGKTKKENKQNVSSRLG